MKKREYLDAGFYWDQASAMLCQAVMLIDCLLEDVPDLTDLQRSMLTNARAFAGEAISELD